MDRHGGRGRLRGRRRPHGQLGTPPPRPPGAAARARVLLPSPGPGHLPSHESEGPRAGLPAAQPSHVIRHEPLAVTTRSPSPWQSSG